MNEYKPHSSKTTPLAITNKHSARNSIDASKRMPAPTAVLFDLDDTLIHSKPIYRAAKEHALAFLDEHSWGEDFKEDLRGQPIHYYVTERLKRATNANGERKFSDDDIPSMVEEYFDFFEQRLLGTAREQLEAVDSPNEQTTDVIHPLKGAHDTLKQLKDGGIPMAIITNSPQKLVDYTLPKLFPDIFDGSATAPKVIGSTRSDHAGKAGERMVLKTLKALNIVPENVSRSVYYVGDTVDHDLDLAYCNEMTGILYGSKDDERLAEGLDDNSPVPASIHSFLHVDNHEELQQLFDAAIQQNHGRNGSEAISRR